MQRICLLVTILALAVGARAQESTDTASRATYKTDSLTVTDIEGHAGDSVWIKMNLHNATGYQALQADVVLPRDWKVVEDVNREFNDTTIVYTAGRAKRHGAIARVRPSRNGTTVRMIIVDMSGHTIDAGNGVVARFRVALPSKPGTHTCRVRNVVYSTGGDDLTLDGHGPATDFKITVKEE